MAGVLFNKQTHTHTHTYPHAHSHTETNCSENITPSWFHGGVKNRTNDRHKNNCFHILYLSDINDEVKMRLLVMRARVNNCKRRPPPPKKIQCLPKHSRFKHTQTHSYSNIHTDKYSHTHTNTHANYVSFYHHHFVLQIARQLRHDQKEKTPIKQELRHQLESKGTKNRVCVYEKCPKRKGKKGSRTSSFCAACKIYLHK